MCSQRHRPINKTRISFIQLNACRLFMLAGLCGAYSRTQALCFYIGFGFRNY